MASGHRRYPARVILPETMQHPVVQFECIDIAFLIMAWGLAPTAGPMPGR